MRIERAEAINWVCGLHPGAIYVVCNAFCRDVYETKDQPNNLYLVHGMGQALAVGTGIAQNTDRQVIVLDGDGNAIMGASMWTMLHTLENLIYYVFVNGVHRTTGRQELILPNFEPDDLYTILIDDSKIGRPKGQEIRPIETDEGFMCPVRAKARFLQWLNG